MNIGPILFQVAMEDITKEVADVIVNSTSKMFTLKSGAYLLTKMDSVLCKNQCDRSYEEVFLQTKLFVDLGLLLLTNIVKINSMGFLTTGNIFENVSSVLTAL